MSLAPFRSKASDTGRQLVRRLVVAVVVHPPGNSDFRSWHWRSVSGRGEAGGFRQSRLLSSKNSAGIRPMALAWFRDFTVEARDAQKISGTCGATGGFVDSRKLQRRRRFGFRPRSPEQKSWGFTYAVALQSSRRLGIRTTPVTVCAYQTPKLSHEATRERLTVNAAHS